LRVANNPDSKAIIVIMPSIVKYTIRDFVAYRYGYFLFIRIDVNDIEGYKLLSKDSIGIFSNNDICKAYATITPTERQNSERFFSAIKKDQRISP
jgi:hypothetical protein